MCGIIGYIGKQKIVPFLINGLRKLEYRGYDSAGIATLHNNIISVTKSIGKIKDLQKIVNENDIANCGIAHTRWATHGQPTINNTHPILSNNEEWAIVHNGIIENFAALKEMLINAGYIFNGDTDTEVIVNLLQYNSSMNIIESIIKTSKMLEGSYALIIINKAKPDRIFIAKNKSPLYICSQNSETVVASDITCFDDIKEYYSLEDNQFAEASINEISFFNNDGKKITKQPNICGKINEGASKQNYNHFMLKEIEETPEILKNIAIKYKKSNIFSIFNKKFLKKFNEIILIGCGTAYHAALMGANYIQQYARIKTSAYIASEFRYSNPLITKKTLCILVSQSGETADTLAVCDLVSSLGATTVALTNVEHSTITKKVNYVLPTLAGKEIAVASTKAYTAQITILYLLACKMHNVLFNKKIKYYSNVINTSKSVNAEKDSYKNLAALIQNKTSIFFIGRDKDYITAREASLKLKEISYINSQAYASGELKHGTLALIDSSSFVLAIATNKNLLSKTLNAIHEIMARGGNVILFTQYEINDYNKNIKVLKLNNVKEDLMTIISIVPLQYMAYFVSVNKGYNPDQPRNLAKSVTVE